MTDSRCLCRCDWCCDLRYYSAWHPAMPEAGPDPDPEWEKRNRARRDVYEPGKKHTLGHSWPCRCHCPWCHHAEPHRLHICGFRLECESEDRDIARQGFHRGSPACRKIPWVADQSWRPELKPRPRPRV